MVGNVVVAFLWLIATGCVVCGPLASDIRNRHLHQGHLCSRDQAVPDRADFGSARNPAPGSHRKAAGTTAP